VIKINKLIEKRLKELTADTNVKYEDVKFVTIKEFEKMPYEKTKLNFLHFLDSLKDIEIQNMINFFLLCKNN